MAMFVPFTTRKNAVKHFTIFRFTLHFQTLDFKSGKDIKTIMLIVAHKKEYFPRFPVNIINMHLSRVKYAGTYGFS